MGINSDSIRRCCYKERKSAGGFIWSYAKRGEIKNKKIIVKKIYQMTTDYKYINYFESIASAIKNTGINIRRNKNQGKCYGGYLWLYEKEYNAIQK